VRHRSRGLAALLAAVALMISTAAEVAADNGGPTLNGVIDSPRLWVVGLLVGLATLFLTIRGARYMTSFLGSEH
jgi:hypothetical protein